MRIGKNHYASIQLKDMRGTTIAEIKDDYHSCAPGYQFEFKTRASHLPTRELVQELASRKEIKTYKVKDEESTIIHVDEPATVLYITEK